MRETSPLQSPQFHGDRSPHHFLIPPAKVAEDRCYHNSGNGYSIRVVLVFERLLRLGLCSELYHFLIGRQSSAAYRCPTMTVVIDAEDLKYATGKGYEEGYGKS